MLRQGEYDIIACIAARRWKVFGTTELPNTFHLMYVTHADLLVRPCSSYMQALT